MGKVSKGISYLPAYWGAVRGPQLSLGRHGDVRACLLLDWATGAPDQALWAVGQAHCAVQTDMT